MKDKEQTHGAVDLSQGRVISTAEAAAYCNYSVDHWRRLYRAGKVPAPLQISGGKFGWRLSELDAWLKAAPKREAA